MTIEPIAIVGHGCILPSGEGSAALWETVHQAKVLIHDVVPSRWRIHRDHILTDAHNPLPERSWNQKGGYVPEELYPTGDLDPVFVWIKQSAEQALAGMYKIDRSRAGIVMGNLSSLC